MKKPPLYPPRPAPPRAHAGGLRPDDSAAARRAAAAAAGGRFDLRGSRRAGDALRAVEWGEITARLNAARDLRLLLRNESRSPIELAAASFGDAAASYFALIDESEPGINPDTLGQSKVFDAKMDFNKANRPGDAADQNAGAAPNDARDM